MIRDECQEVEETGKLSGKVLDFIYEHRLFKLFVPEAFGGKMTDFPSAVKVFQEAARIDGNFGWLVTIGSGGGMFVSNMTEEAAKASYFPREAVIAGSGFPSGFAQPTDDGYIINGEWFYCSGSQYATVFTATCMVGDGDETEQKILAFALDPEQVEVLGDWGAFGLKGTSSHSIRVVEQFVPQHKVFSVFEVQNDGGGAVHSLPFLMFSEASFAAISLGIGRHFLEEVEAILHKNEENWQKGPVNRYAVVKEKLLAEKARLEKANRAFHNLVHSVWEQHTQGIELPSELQREFSTIAKRSTSTAIYCADNLFRYIGMQAVMEKNSLNRIWRDLHTASQHMFLTPYNEVDSLPFD